MDKNAISFNNIESTDSSLGIELWNTWNRPILPASRDMLTAIHGKSGVYDYGKDLSYIEISCSFLIVGNSSEVLRQRVRNVAAWLNVAEAKPLIFGDEPNKRYMARPINIVSANRKVLTEECSVVFMVPEGCAESVTTKIATVFPATNEGTIPCPAIIKAVMPSPAEYFKIELVNGNKYLLINTELVQGDTITIDTRRHLVLINEIDARVYLTAASTYPTLPPGEFSFITEPAGVPLTVEYCERWI